MDKTLTQEMRERLKPYERNLYTATYERWARMSSVAEYNAVYAAYVYLTGDRAVNRNCQACLLDMLALVGRSYFAEQKLAVKTKSKKNAVQSKKQSQSLTADQ